MRMLFVSPMCVCLISFSFFCLISTFQYRILHFIVVFSVVVVLCEFFSFSSDYSIFSMYIEFLFLQLFSVVSTLSLK